MTQKITHFCWSRGDLGPNQACTLFGSKGGANVISGSSYISAGYGLNVDDLWRRNLPVLLAFFIFFQLTQLFVLEFYPVRQHFVDHETIQ